MRACIYLRVSTVEQLTGHSLDAQRTATTRFIQQRGWTQTQEYLDAGVSAKSDVQRPALTLLLADAAQHRFDVVVVDKIDRFYRSLKGLLITLERLDHLGITFVSVKENLDFTTPWGKLSLTMLGMLAEIYLDNLSQETQKGLRARARKGLWNGSIPLGYCRGNCSSCSDPNGPEYCPHAGQPDQQSGPALIAHPLEALAVQRAFTWYLTGNYSDGQIAERLNQEPLLLPDGSTRHFRTKGLPGRWPPGPFSKESVRELLQRPFYTGVVPYYGVDEQGRKRKRTDTYATFPGQHPALISATDFTRAQEIRQQLARRSRHPNGQPRIYLLSGLLVCAHCGRTLRAMTSGGRCYYRDLTRIDHSGDCDQPTLRATDIEAQVLAFVNRLRLPPDWRAWCEQTLRAPAEQAAYEQQLAQLRARWQRAQELYLAGTLSKEDFQRERWRYQADANSLTPKEISAIIEAGNTLEALPEVLATGSTLKQNELLRLVLAGAQVKGYLLTAVQANLHFYPLMQYCLCGSDGTRTRDLRLDRPACSTTTLRPLNILNNTTPLKFVNP